MNLPITSAIAIYTVAVQPLLSGALACCCPPPADTQHPCCEEGSKVYVLSEAACHAPQGEASTADGSRVGGCCCADTIPEQAVRPARHEQTPGFAAPPAVDTVWAADPPDLVLSVATYYWSDRLFLHGPPLLALYCTWLK